MTGSLRQASVAAAAAIVVLTAVAAALIPVNGGAARAARAAACTYEQKQAAGAGLRCEVFEDSAVKVEVLARDAKAFRVRVTRK